MNQEQENLQKSKFDDIYTEGEIICENYKKNKIKFFAKFFVFILIFAIIGLTLFSGKPSEKSSASKSFSWLSNFSLVGQLRQLAVSSDRKLKGEDSGRINILLLGIGGKNHDGGTLTDTMMIVSIEPTTKKVAMISIPRDLTVPIEGMGWRKINSVNAYAEKENPGSGGLAASQSVSQIFNLPIDYYLRVDFEAFAKIIDELGGVDVTVENLLDDYKYPILGLEDDPSYYARYEHLHVEPGPQHMDGSLALKYARSRHALGVEGTDFARAKRQQIIIEGVKEKLFSMNILFKPTLISNIINTYQEHVSTNLQIWEMVKLWGLVKETKKDQIINKVLDNSVGGLLIDKRGEDGAYILTPKSGDFSQIQYMISSIFGNAPSEVKKEVLNEQATIELRNGTWINGLANKASTDLESYGFVVTGIGNASQRNFQKSVIYDLTNGAKTQSLTLLKNKTQANISFGLPEWLATDLAKEKTDNPDKKNPDFVLVLGQSADSTSSGVQNKTE